MSTEIGSQKVRHVAREVAESELQRFIETMDLTDKLEAKMSEDDTRSLANTKERLIAAIMRGHLVVDDKGQPVYTPQLGICEPITFYEPTGATFMAMDGAAKGKDMAKMFRMLGEMCQCDPSRFSKMKNRDLGVCLAVMTLFLAQ